jgi:hypothetical protein
MIASPIPKFTTPVNLIDSPKLMGDGFDRINLLVKVYWFSRIY